MKICGDCGCENIDEAEFCRNCGSKLTMPEVKPQKSRPIDDTKVVVRDKNNSIISRLFFKTDKYTGDLRIAKAKSISIIVFIGFFILMMAVGLPGVSFIALFFTAIIFALIFAIPTFIIGYIIGWIIDKITH